jgi:hypothetical protein
MKLTNKITEGHARDGLMLLTLFAAFASSAFASNKPAKPEEVTATVVAHTPLPSAPGNQMLMLRKGSKQYLYIQEASRQGYMIVEVTKANEPNVLKSTAPPNSDTAGNLEMVSPDVAIAEAPEKNSATVNTVARPTKSVKVLDLSDPANPKTVQTFEGVTSVLQDSGRIYLTNNEGLWILEYSRYQKRQVPLCDSESVFSPIVDCQ